MNVAFMWLKNENKNDGKNRLGLIITVLTIWQDIAKTELKEIVYDIIKEYRKRKNLITAFVSVSQSSNIDKSRLRFYNKCEKP